LVQNAPQNADTSSTVGLWIAVCTCGLLTFLSIGAVAWIVFKSQRFESLSVNLHLATQFVLRKLQSTSETINTEHQIRTHFNRHKHLTQNIKSEHTPTDTNNQHRTSNQITLQTDTNNQHRTSNQNILQTKQTLNTEHQIRTHSNRHKQSTYINIFIL